MISQKLFARFYGHPGSSPYDGTQIFFRMIRHHARAEARVLNLGAGPATNNPVCVIKGEVAKVIGADIDPVVLTNDELDDAAVIHNDRLPFDDESFDLVFSDFVLEHVERPTFFLAEIYRVLKPGC
ncbi:MAG: class I SAM-dependent methyltransferase, partial [Verrucomicrobiales bacterium]|nr:class I SAM-dependent methyltransferase [Verrucomicrobiales bacterium]